MDIHFYTWGKYEASEHRTKKIGKVRWKKQKKQDQFL